MRYEEPGMFWLPEVYGAKLSKNKGERVKQVRAIPPTPDTGWAPREHFPDLSAARIIGIDTETFDPDLNEKGPGCRRDGYIVGVSVAADNDFAMYYPVAHSMGKNLDKAKVFAWLGEQLGRPQQQKVGANVLYDLDFLACEGVTVRGMTYDVLYADPILNEYETSYSLDAVATRRLGEHKDTPALYEWCAAAYGGKVDSKQRANIWRAPVELVGPYAEQDARLPVRILRAQWPMLRERGLLDIFRMECELIPLLLRLRQQGVLLDLNRVSEIDKELTHSIELIKQDVGINVYAAAELQALCDKEGIEYPRTAPTDAHPDGQPSFVKKWLAEHTHPTLRRISELRGLYKLRDTFVRGALMNKHINGTVHCEFHPLRSDDYGTVGGRYSSSNPNLQQIPTRTELGRLLRECFIPHNPDLVWMKNDMSQIEFRLGVHYGVGDGIEDVRNAYRTDHKTSFYKLAASLTALDYDTSKAISLGTLYGMREKKFAAVSGKTLKEAFALFAQFNAMLPFMRATYEYYQAEAEASATEDADGFVRTIGGRICNLPTEFSHKALNRKLQGSCADWIKRSMLNAYRAGIFDVLTLYLTVHDELDSGVPRTAGGLEAARELHHIMTHAYELSIPVLAGVDIGRNWGQLRKLDIETLNLEALCA